MVLDTTGYTDEMAPAVRNIARTLLVQDLPALITAAETGGESCPDCASIHRVHHMPRNRLANDTILDLLRADTIEIDF